MSAKRLIISASGILILLGILGLGAVLDVQAGATSVHPGNYAALAPVSPSFSSPAGSSVSSTTNIHTNIRSDKPVVISSVTPCDPESDYVVVPTAGASIVPGVTDIGNHCMDCITSLALPFPVRLYNSTFTNVNVSSHGNLQFNTN